MPTPKVAIRFIFATLVVGMIVNASGQVYQPISTTNCRPYSLLFLRFDPSGELLPIGSREFSTQFTAANTLTLVNKGNSPLIYEDIEADILRMNYSYRGRNGIQFQVSVPFEDLGAGFMDPILDWYHRTILHQHSIRSYIPYGGHIVLGPSGGPYYGGISIGDTRIMASLEIFPRTLGSIGIKLPTGNPTLLTGSGRPDFGVSLERFIPVGKFFGLTLQGATVAQSQAIGLKNARPIAWQLCASLTWAPNSRDRWTLQYQRENSALNMGVPVSDQIHSSTSLGYLRNLSNKEEFEAFFSEDMDLFDPNWPVGNGIGPDFVFGMKLTWQLS